MNIRAAAADESGILAAIDAQHPYSAHWSEAQIQGETVHSAGRVLVAEIDEKITGFIAFRSAGGVGEILNLAVDRAALRQQTGTSLVQAALAQMRTEGTEEVALEVNENNLPAQGLYLKTGFKVLGRRKKFYNNTTDALIMGITL